MTNSWIFPFMLVVAGYGLCNAFVLHGQPRQRRITSYLGALAANPDKESTSAGCSRRDVLFSTCTTLTGILAATTATALTSPKAAMAAIYVLDDETGEYVEANDVPWQQAWKERLDKASTMSKDEIFQAARGAGNVDLKQGPESEASKKRRAMSACRDPDVRSKAGAGTEIECTKRVFAGEVDFMLEAL